MEALVASPLMQRVLYWSAYLVPIPLIVLAMQTSLLGVTLAVGVILLVGLWVVERMHNHQMKVYTF